MPGPSARGGAGPVAAAPSRAQIRDEMRGSAFVARVARAAIVRVTSPDESLLENVA